MSPCQATKSISGSRHRRLSRSSWSKEIGKRVREGPWTDQAVSTTRKFEDALDAGQLELAAQLVDYFMEEAKVVYVIYDVWSEGFRGWLSKEGVGEAELGEVDARLRRLLAFPDGSEYEPRGRWTAMAASAGTVANLLRSVRGARPQSPGTLRRAARELAPAARPRRRLHVRAAHLHRRTLRRGGDRELLQVRARALPAGALRALRHPPPALRRDDLPQPLSQLRGDARPPLWPRAHAATSSSPRTKTAT